MEAITFEIGGVLGAYGTSPDMYNPTQDLPTKSAIIGMIAASKGIKRSEKQKLAQLYNQYTVKVKPLKPIKKFTEFQTIAISNTKNQLVYRQHLEDCQFEVTIIGQDANKLKYNLTHPVFQLYLGRKACTLDRPIKFK